MPRVSGWLETEIGGVIFNIEEPTLTDVAEKLIETYPEDAGFTDMEATNSDGEDITGFMYRLIDNKRKLMDTV